MCEGLKIRSLNGSSNRTDVSGILAEASTFRLRCWERVDLSWQKSCKTVVAMLNQSFLSIGEEGMKHSLSWESLSLIPC